jgi:hypothetical protein
MPPNSFKNIERKFGTHVAEANNRLLMKRIPLEERSPNSTPNSNLNGQEDYSLPNSVAEVNSNLRNLAIGTVLVFASGAICCGLLNQLTTYLNK